MSIAQEGAPAVLVTGGAGYIGSHVCKALAAAGLRPLVLDNLSTGHAHMVRWGPLVQADLRIQSEIDQIFATHRPAAVIHLAASAYVGESRRDPGKYYRNNVGATINLLD